MTKLLSLCCLFLISSTFAAVSGQGELTFKGSDVIKKKVDLLFVIDKSGSMQDFSQEAKARMQEVLHQIDYVADWQAAFITSDIDDLRNFGLDSSINHRIVDRHNYVENAIDLLWDFYGSADEKLFESVFKKVGQMPGFKRVNSELYIIYLTDEDDQSTTTAKEFIENYKKQFDSTFNFRLVSKKDGTNCPLETYDRLLKLQELLSLSFGEYYSLCDDFSRALATSIAKAVQLDLKVTLPKETKFKVLIDGKPALKTHLNSDQRTLFFRPEVLNLDSEIKVLFDL